MKIKSLQLTNFSNYDKVSVSFDENVSYLIGKNGAGKTTLGLTGIHFMFQGIAEKEAAGTCPVYGERFRFIGKSGATAKGEMILHDEVKNIDITVRRKLTKTGSELSFVAPEGIVLSQQWLTDLFNIFLIAPKKFMELSGKDQAKAIGIDISSYDSELAILKQEFTMINRDFKNIGEIEVVEKIEKVDLDDLMLQKEAIANKIKVQYLENKRLNEAARKKWMQDCDTARSETTTFNALQLARQDKIDTCTKYMNSLVFEGYAGSQVQEFIDGLEKPEQIKEVAKELPNEPEYIPEMPEDKEGPEIDVKIAGAVETNTKAAKYDEYLKKQKLFDDKTKEVENNKSAQYKKTNERLEYIKSFELPFEGLEVNDEGDLLLQNKPLREPYFSTGELLKIIPELIAVQNPEMKYIFIQDGSLLDEDNLKELETYLVGKGFQLVIELIVAPENIDKNIIVLKENKIVE